MASQSQTLASVDASSVGFVESIDPATGEVMARIAATSASALPDIFKRARGAQAAWARRPLRERCKGLRLLRRAIFDARDEAVDVITRESGKPRVEAIFAELLVALDTADFLARRAEQWLRPERVPHHNPALRAKSGWLEYEPLGVFAVISPWNYPFVIPIS